MLLKLKLLLLCDAAVADDDCSGDAAVGDSPVGADAADASGVHVPVVPRLWQRRLRKMDNEYTVFLFDASLDVGGGSPIQTFTTEPSCVPPNSIAWNTGCQAKDVNVTALFNFVTSENI